MRWELRRFFDRREYATQFFRNLVAPLLLFGEYPCRGVQRRQFFLLATAELRIPSLKSSAQLIIEDMHPYLQ